MKTIASHLLATLLTLGLLTQYATPLHADDQEDLTQYVNPQIDTHNSRWFYFSSACRPFGMVNLSPDTQTKGSWKSGYLYDDDSIRCFSHVHAWQMSGIPVMPTTGPFQGHLGMDKYQSKYSHDNEIVSPGYHKVHLDTYGITAELTSTCRVGFHRYTFPESEQSHIIFDTGAFLGHGPMVSSKVKSVGESEIEGYSLMEKTSRRSKDTYVYFVAQFSKPSIGLTTWSKGKLKEESKGDHSDSIEGPDVGAAVKFVTAKDEQIMVKVGLSYTSIENARKNLNAEVPDWEFDRVHRESTQQWNHWLSRVKVDGGKADYKTKLYTDLWHSLLGRRIISDADGSYCDMTGPEPVIRQPSMQQDGKASYPHYNFDALVGKSLVVERFVVDGLSRGDGRILQHDGRHVSQRRIDSAWSIGRKLHLRNDRRSSRLFLRDGVQQGHSELRRFSGLRRPA